MPKRRKKKSLKPTQHRVYCTYFPDGRYYIGYSCKPEKQWDKYYGSSREIKENGTKDLKKELIATFTSRNQAKMQEMLYQLEYRHDEYCINDMIHIRLRLSHLKDFEMIDWSPTEYTLLS